MDMSSLARAGASGLLSASCNRPKIGAMHMPQLKAAYDALRAWADEHRKASAVIAGFLVGVAVGAIMF